MGVEKLHSLGREQDVRVLFETGFGTYTAPASTAYRNRGIQANNCNIDVEKQVITRKFTNPLSEDLTAQLRHKTVVSANLDCDIVPSGTIGMPPNIFPLLMAGLGGMKYTAKFTVTDYSSVNNDTFNLIMYDHKYNNVTEQFVEGTDFNDGGSNNDCATNLAAEMLERTGTILSASVSSNEITFTTKDHIIALDSSSLPAGLTLTFISVEFVGKNRQRSLPSLGLFQKMSTLSRVMVGGWVNDFSVKVDGSKQPTLAFKLGGKDTIHTVAVGIASITDSDTLVIDDANCLMVNSLVQFEASDGSIDDNSGNGYLVSTKSGTSITFSSNHNASDTDTIYPFLPTPTYNGEALGDLDGSITLDGDTFNLVNFELECKRNIKPHADNAFQETVSDYTQSYREVSGKVSFRSTKEEAALLAAYYIDPLTDHTLTLVVGETAGYIMTITLPKVRFSKVPVTTPNDGDVMIDVEFVALASSNSAQDSVTVKFT